MKRAAEWSVPFDKLAEKIGARLEDVVRNVEFELFSRVVLRTPVDTGRARGNWFPSYGEMRTRVTTIDDKAGDRTLQAIRNAVMSHPMGGTMYLTNSLPYIGVLEYGGYPNPPKNPTGKTVNGFSKQAPAGMVRVTITEVNGILKEKMQ